MTMDTVTKSPQRINDLDLIIQIYAYLYSKLDAEPDSHRRSKRMRQDTAVDHVVEGIRLVRGSTTRETASMLFGRMRDAKHRLAKESIPLVSLDYSMAGPPLVICHYDPASLQADVVVGHSPSVDRRDSTPPPKTTPVMAQASSKPPLSWSPGRVKHLINRLCYSIESDKRILRDAETALRNKWDQTGKFDIPATVKKLLEYGYFKSEDVTHRNETFTALVLQKTTDEIVNDLRKRGELSEDNATRTSLAPEAPAAPNRLAPKPAPPEPPAPRPAPVATMDRVAQAAVETHALTRRGQSRSPVAGEQRAAYVLPAEEELVRTLRLLIARHGVGHTATAADLFGTAALSQEQMVILGRFCDAELLRTVRGGWQIIYDARRLVHLPITERRAVLAPENRRKQLEIIQQVWETESKNGTALKQSFFRTCGTVMDLQANSVEVYFFGNDPSGGASRALGVLMPVSNDSSRCYLAPDSLAGCDFTPGTHKARSILLHDSRQEDRVHLQAIAKKYIAIASRELEPLPFEGQAQPAAKPEPVAVVSPPSAPSAPTEVAKPVETTAKAASDAILKPAVEEAPAPVEPEAVVPTPEPTAGETSPAPAPVEEVPAPTMPTPAMEVAPETPPSPAPEPVVPEPVPAPPEPPATDNASLRATMRVPAPAPEHEDEAFRHALSTQCRRLEEHAVALEREAAAKREQAIKLRRAADALDEEALSQEGDARSVRQRASALQERIRRLAELDAERQAILAELTGALP